MRFKKVEIINDGELPPLASYWRRAPLGAEHVYLKVTLEDGREFDKNYLVTKDLTIEDEGKFMQKALRDAYTFLERFEICE